VLILYLLHLNRPKYEYKNKMKLNRITVKIVIIIIIINKTNIIIFNKLKHVLGSTFVVLRRTGRRSPPNRSRWHQVPLAFFNTDIDGGQCPMAGDAV